MPRSTRDEGRLSSPNPPLAALERSKVRMRLRSARASQGIDQIVILAAAFHGDAHWV